MILPINRKEIEVAGTVRGDDDGCCGHGITRRKVFGGAALLALALGVPVGAFAANQVTASPHQLLLRHVCQIVIPRTDTPGAGDTGVAEFVVLACAHGLEGATNEHLAWLDHAVGKDFTSLNVAKQAEIVGALDRAAFPAGPPPQSPSPWRTIKALILTGYYTSETGASKELQYELVPGRFDADLPLHPGDRAWSSDWTAVDFG